MTVASEAVGSLVANIILSVLATTAVTPRFLARKKSGAALKLNDWTILGCLISAIAISISAIYAAATDLHGVPWNLMTRESFITFRKLEFSDILLCHFIFGLTKLSIILFYKRIFSIGHFTTFANIALVAASLFISLSFFLVVFCSKPVNSFWTTIPMLEDSQDVIDPPALISAIAGVDIALDVVVLSLPLPPMKKLHMSAQKRWYIAGIFLLGAL
ncbi:hypothetical protein B0J14DRAFT_707004 [Halenospora varia]|nr:hypothetical protein B0J14DRAFT_707004 [Halenospora varia]